MGVPFSLAPCLGDHDHRAVVASVALERKAYAGVAGSSLDDHASRSQLAARFGVEHDVECRAILDRPAGVHELARALPAPNQTTRENGFIGRGPASLGRIDAD